MVPPMNSRTSAHSIRFHMSLTAEKYLAFYRGQAHDIVVRSEDNRSIRFPASAVREFLTRDGVFGRFEIQFDENNKLIGVRQLSVK